MIQLVAVQTLRAVIGAVENRCAIRRLDDGFDAIGADLDQLQLGTTIDVAWLPVSIDKLEATAGAVQHLGHALLRKTVWNDEEADLVT